VAREGGMIGHLVFWCCCIPWTVLLKTSLKDKFDDLSEAITLVEVALAEVEQGQVGELDG
jgi:hypothetical protein